MSDSDKKVILRPYQDGDRETLAEFLALLQGHIADLDQMTQHIPYSEFDKDTYCNQRLEEVSQNAGQVLMAEVDGQTVGAIVSWRRAANDDDQVECYPRQIAYVSDMYVDPDCRGLGIGARLLAEVEKAYGESGCEMLALTCMARNIRAKNFYENMGYDDYAVRMVKKLSE